MRHELARRSFAALCLAGAVTAASAPSFAARIKDIATFEGVRENQLVGYGLIVGLNGTGDGSQSVFTPQSLANLLRRLGVVVDPARVRVKNVAAVMITADMPPFARSGKALDVVVSSIGDAKSLAGGTLMLAPLRGPDGSVYASAQGPVSVGGAFSASAGGSTAVRNHPTAGRIPGGAILERDVVVPIESLETFRLLLNDADFTTASRVERAINEAIGAGTARAVDGGEIVLTAPATDEGRIAFLSRIEALTVDSDAPARLVFNERTGTVVMGADLRISRVAISHGSLTVRVDAQLVVSQPAPLSHKGETVVDEQQDLEAEEERASVLILDEGATISDLVNGLNRIGATARDMMAIFQAIRAAGALQAEIVVQ